MKLCMFSPKGQDLRRGWPGRVEGDRVVQLAAQTLQSFFSGGGSAREHAEYPLDEVDLRPPVLHPPAVRDFYAFEQHVSTARGLRGLDMVPEWYEMPARVNGEERSRGNMGDMHHSWDAIVEHAGRNTRLRPGDVLGSGTVGTGCILEHGDGRWLQPGDEVELEIEGIGVLRNT